MKKKDNIFKRRLNGEKAKPYKIPELQEGYTRIPYVDIPASTEKAVLFQLEDQTKWIPKSVCLVHFVEKKVDILNTFYDKNLA
jgi:hypothetical protein